MSYYEELGLAPSASHQEIREAYKSLVRLLHPDRMQDDKLRRLAECQMQRLNTLVAVLTDAARRAEYDASLCRTALPKPARVGAVFREMRGWEVAALLMAAGLLLVAVAGTPFRRASRRPDTLAAAGATGEKDDASASLGQNPAAGRTSGRADSQRQIAALRAEVKALRRERDRAVADLLEAPAGAEVADLPGAHTEAQTGAGPPVGNAAGRTDMGEMSRVAGGLALESPGFGGSWFYAPRKSKGRSAQYPPEYIEAAIRQEAGWLRGRYRALYRVGDRAISPEVIFQFEGHAGKTAADLEWSNPDGARGVVHLRLLSEDSMEVKWSATALGGTLELASGTAVLIRRHVP